MGKLVLEIKVLCFLVYAYEDRGNFELFDFWVHMLVYYYEDIDRRRSFLVHAC